MSMFPVVFVLQNSGLFIADIFWAIHCGFLLQLLKGHQRWPHLEGLLVFCTPSRETSACRVQLISNISERSDESYHKSAYYSVVTVESRKLVEMPTF